MALFLVLGLICAASSVIGQLQNLDGRFVHVTPYIQTLSTPTVFVTVTETTGTVTITQISTVDTCVPMQSTIINSQYVTTTFVSKATVLDGTQTITTSLTTAINVNIGSTFVSSTSVVPVTEAATEFSTIVIPETITSTVTNYKYDYDTTTQALWLEQTDFFTKMVVKTVLIPRTEDVTVTKTVTDTFIVDVPVRH